MTVEQATVYRTLAGRRYFTKTAALRREVMARLMRKHEKAGITDRLVGGEHQQDVFFTDSQMEYFLTVRQRYMRRFMRRF